MVMLAPAVARCLVRACPWRWRTGPDRICPLHQADADTTPGLVDRAATYADVMITTPAGRDGSGSGRTTA